MLPSAASPLYVHSPPTASLPPESHLEQRSYIADWFGVLLLVICNLATLFLEPFHRLFSLDDRRIQFPHADPERVPVPYLLLYTIAIPMLVITLYMAIFPSTSRRSHKLHVALLGLCTSLLLAAFITDLIKNGVGRPRPDLIARCKPISGTPEHQLVFWDVCTETDHHTLHDGFRSFPSGHSSFSWAGLGFLTLFLCGQLGALKRGRGMARVVVSALPLVGATLITISRTEDYRHDVWDVCTGTLIGVMCALFCYGRYFRGLADRRCDVPYESEEEGDEATEIEFERVRDLEMQDVGMSRSRSTSRD